MENHFKIIDYIPRLKEAAKKYQYILLLMLIGIILVTIPWRYQKADKTLTVEDSESIEEIEKRLTDLLSKGKGVGRVKVMITLDCSDETVYMQDATYKKGGDVIDEKKEVSMASEGNTEIPLVQETRSEKYRGACIVCDGADNIQVRLWITEAVSDLLNLGTDRISIIQYDVKG